MKGRNAQVARIYRILNILEGAPHGLSAAEITDRIQERGWDVSKRTVYRDLEALQAAGFPLEERGETDANATRWTLERAVKVNQGLVLDSREILALYLARQALSPLRETPFYEDLENLFAKIEDKLGAKAREHLSEAVGEFRFEPGPSWGLGVDPEIVDTVRAACAENQQLEFVYSSVNSDSTRLRLVGPHYLYFARGSLYLVAEDLEEGRVKVFGVPRMKEARMREEAYSGRVIDPEELFESAFGVFTSSEPIPVKLKFSKILAPYIRERRWHKTQTIVNLASGEIEFSMEAGITPELVQWVLGFGEHVKILAPSLLVKKVCDAAAKVLGHYKHVG